MDVSRELFDNFIMWLINDGLKPRKSERLWRKTIFARLLNNDKKTLANWEDFMVDYKNKKVDEYTSQYFDENSLIGIGVSNQGIHKTIRYVVKGQSMSRVFFERDGGAVDVENSVLIEIINVHERNSYDNR